MKIRTFRTGILNFWIGGDTACYSIVQLMVPLSMPQKEAA
jgi:hypothetical protein